VSVLLLVAIGFLLGRTWKGRLLWALGTLFVTSLIFAIVVGAAGAAVPIPDRIVERPEGQDATQVGIVMADKADEIAHNAINTLIWGLEVKLIICLVVSGVAIAGVVAWYIYDRRRRERETPVVDPGRPPVSSDPGNPSAPIDPGSPPA
jgi:membrane protease YdiL (CAAX protease family)